MNATRGIRKAPLAVALLAALALAPPAPPAGAQDKDAPAAEAPAPDLTAIETALAGSEPEKAAAELRRLAEKGDPAAQVLFGDLHMIGKGVVQNYSLAGIWFRKAAAAGHADAQYKLGLLYDLAHGVPLDPQKSREWLVLAAAQGHQMARTKLIRLRIPPPPVTPKEPEAAPPGEAKGAPEPPAQAMVEVRLVGMGPPVREPDPAVAGLVERFVKAVNDNDLESLKKVIGPEYAACATDQNRKIYEDFLAMLMRYELPAAYKARVGQIDRAQPLPFADYLAFPLPPVRYVMVEFEGAPPPGAAEVQLVPTMVQFLARHERRWTLVLGCPTPAGIERLRRALAGAATGEGKGKG